MSVIATMNTTKLIPATNLPVSYKYIRGCRTSPYMRASATVDASCALDAERLMGEVQEQYTWKVTPSR